MLQVVLTGGPSSGKTSVINRVVEQFKELGYKVIVVPETAPWSYPPYTPCSPDKRSENPGKDPVPLQSRKYLFA